MTGSILVHVLMPIVIPALLVAWLAIVFYADAHPPAAGHEPEKAGDDSGERTDPGYPAQQQRDGKPMSIGTSAGRH